MLLKAEKITKKYGGVVALNQVDFDVVKGEIHGLVGVNGCGKSTLMKIIAGAEHQTKGKIYIDDEEKPPYGPAEAMQYGIGIIYQDLSLFPNLSVFENIYLSKVIASGRKAIKSEQYRAGIEEIIKKLDIKLDLSTELSELPIAKQQLVAIIRALFNQSRLIILDEPTTALTSSEIEHLFEILNNLKAQGISFIFISHKLTEMTQICDRITVFKNGNFINTFQRTEGFTISEIEKAMLGKEITYKKYPTFSNQDKVLLQVSNLTKRNNFKDICFTLHEGEILGIAGQLGSGRTELAKALFGSEPADSGEIIIDGKKVSIGSIKNAVDEGIAYVPEDRLSLGLVLAQSIRRNATLVSLKALSNPFGNLNIKRLKQLALDLLESLKVKYGRPSDPITSLSGGNQQKIVIAKWLAINPKILILDSPTVGIDVGAKSSIYDTVHSKAKEHMGFLFISDELPELLSNCDRIAVMSHGKIKAVYDANDLDEDKLQKIIQGQ